MRLVLIFALFVCGMVGVRAMSLEAREEQDIIDELEDLDDIVDEEEGDDDDEDDDDDEEEMINVPAQGPPQWRKRNFMFSDVIKRQSVTLVSDAVQQIFVDTHNAKRSIVSPSATNMLKMKWSDALATTAQAYANLCIFGHNDQRTSQTTGFSYVGENIYVSSSTSMTESFAADNSVTLWDNEKADYTYSTDQCATGKVCGHYTQVVWANSEYVGCGVAVCPSGITGAYPQGTIVVCNYGEGGNYQGQLPYQSGTPCTGCQSGYTCDNNLCSDSTTTTQPTTTQSTTTQPTTTTTQASTSQSTTAQPTTSQPTTTTTTQSSTSQSTTAQPTTSQPSTTTQSSTSQSTTAQPTTSQPTTTQSPTTQSTTTQPTTSQPTTAQPTTSQPTTTQSPTSQPTTSIPVSPSLTCNFEDGTTCSFENVNLIPPSRRQFDDVDLTSDDFDWTMDQQGPTRTRGTGPRSASEGSRYGYIEASRPRRTGDRALLKSKNVLAASIPHCMTFDYQMFSSNGRGVGSLAVITRDQTDYQEELFSLDGNRGPNWRNAIIEIPASLYALEVFIEGVRGRNARSDIAIDNIVVNEGGCGCAGSPCENGGTCTDTTANQNGFICTCASGYGGDRCNEIDGTVGCTFTAGEPCFLSASPDSDFPWFVGTRTPSRRTGPQSPLDGPFAYIEASRRQAGSTFILTTEGNDLGTLANQDWCLSFSYNMFGNRGMGGLAVGQVMQDNFVAQWTTAGNQGRQWKSARVHFPASSDLVIEIRAVRGRSFKSDIAIDNVVLTPSGC